MAARTLGQILDRYRASKQWQAKSDADHQLDVAAMLEVLDIAGVPVEQYENCYRAARQTQLERQAAGESVGPLGADELAVEWLKLRKFNEEMEREGQRVRMLSEHAASQCQRCFGKKPFVDACDHKPLTVAERAEQLRINAEESRRLREELARRPVAKAMPREDFKHDLTVTYTCTSCGRKANSGFGWAFNDPCGVRLPGPVREDERLACPGRMQVR